MHRQLSNTTYRKRRGLHQQTLNKQNISVANFKKLDKLPTYKRDAITGEIVDHRPVTQTAYKMRIQLNRVIRFTKADNAKQQESLQHLSFIHIQNKNNNQKRKQGQSPSNKGILKRAVNTHKAYKRTVFITDFNNWDSEIIEIKRCRGNETFHETIHFNIKRWRHYIRKRQFPDVSKVEKGGNSVQEYITVAG